MPAVIDRYIGLEIEVPFKFYYPELHAKHFGQGQQWLSMTMEQREALSEDASYVEPAVYEKLRRATEKYGLSKGSDRYWEFVFPPTKNKQRNIDIICDLIDAKLMPMDDPLAIHITIGNITRDQAFSTLLMLEQIYCTADRIAGGFNDFPHLSTWNRKGVAGIKEKDRRLLLLDDTAFELRTIKIPMRNLHPLLGYVESLLVMPDQTVTKAKAWVQEMGLPWAAWGEEEFKIYSTYLQK